MYNERTQDEPCACQFSCKSRASADCTEENTSSKTGIRVLLTEENIGWKHCVLKETAHPKIKVRSWNTTGDVWQNVKHWQLQSPFIFIASLAVSLDILSITEFCFWLLTEERKSYGFGTTWGRVSYDRSFIFAWTIYSRLILFQYTYFSYSHSHCTDKWWTNNAF